MASKFIGDHSGDGSQLSNVDASTLGGLANTAFSKRADSASNGFWSLDSRSVNDLPAGRGRGVYADFKQNSTNGLSDGGTYNGVITFRTYGGTTDLSGGMPHQLGFTENGNVWHRKGSSASAWTGWNKMWHSGNDGSGSGLDADLLDGVQSTSFLRSDANDTATGNVTFYNDAGINIYAVTNGAGAKIKFSDVATTQSQFGTLEYVHQDTNSYGSGNAFKFYGTEASMSFHVAGTGLFTGDLTAYYSDERLKNFSGKIENALDKVCSLNGYYYKGNETAGELGYDTDVQQVGVSAQEVQAVLPEVVKDAPINADKDTDYMTVQYERMAPMFIEAIKEMKILIESQQAKINELEEKLNGK